MQEMKYIPIDEMVHKGLYHVKWRAGHGVGIWYEGRGMAGMRIKFGSKFMSVEHHWDEGPPFGTARPIEFIEERTDAPDYPEWPERPENWADLPKETRNEYMTPYWDDIHKIEALLIEKNKVYADQEAANQNADHQAE